MEKGIEQLFHDNELLIRILPTDYYFSNYYFSKLDGKKVMNCEQITRNYAPDDSTGAVKKGRSCTLLVGKVPIGIYAVHRC